MRARNSAPTAGLESPYCTTPAEGGSNVAAIASSVDLPAPLAPSNATISPASHRKLILLRTRRLPKCRETSVKVSERKSISALLRCRLVVELRVDALQ